MRIAQLGNLYQPVPALEYGGTQRAIAQIAAFQAALFGHEVTVYAPSDSAIAEFTQKISLDLCLRCEVDPDTGIVAVISRDGKKGSVRLVHEGFSSIGYNDPDEEAKHLALLKRLLQDEQNCPYDVIHNHHRWYMNHGILAAGLKDKTITHQHHAVLEDTYQQSEYALICISKSQAQRMQQCYQANVSATIYHGLDPCQYKPTILDAGYLVWIGRFLHEKGAHRAIRIAAKANLPLLIAGTVYNKKPESIRYFEKEIAPFLTVWDTSFLDDITSLRPEEINEKIRLIARLKKVDSPIIFCGAANEVQKQTLFGSALATLFPISWPEPFGLVMIESMACGTPVIGYESLGRIHCGAVGEIINKGKSGFLINGEDENDAIDQSVEAIKQLSTLDRTVVRDTFSSQWSSLQTASQINELYKKIQAENNPLILNL